MKKKSLTCPHCGVELVAKVKMGDEIECTNCRKTFPFGANIKESGKGSVDSKSVLSISSTANRDFSTLLANGKFISTMGYIWVALSVIIGLYFAQQFEKPNPLIFGAMAAILGFVIIAFGQLISCFVSMERGIQDIKKEIINLNKGNQ